MSTRHCQAVSFLAANVLTHCIRRESNRLLQQDSVYILPHSPHSWRTGPHLATGWTADLYSVVLLLIYGARFHILEISRRPLTNFASEESSYVALFRVRRVLATQVLLVPTLSILQLHSSIKLALLRLLTDGYIWENSNSLRESHLIYVGVFI